MGIVRMGVGLLVTRLVATKMRRTATTEVVAMMPTTAMVPIVLGMIRLVRRRAAHLRCAARRGICLIGCGWIRTGTALGGSILLGITTTAHWSWGSLVVRTLKSDTNRRSHHLGC